jgi:hypothetical protein
MVFCLDSKLPVTSIALFPVELAVFADAGNSGAQQDGLVDCEEDAAGISEERLLRQREELPAFKARFPFARCPAFTPSGGASAHASYMLAVGFNQVG